MKNFDECVSLIDMAEMSLENPDDDSCYISAKTVNIVKNEFPIFLSTAKVIWPEDFGCILTPEEEEAATEAVVNIITNGINHVEKSDAYVDDAITLIMTATMIMYRVEEYRA